MLYYLFKWLDEMDVPGAGLFQYISFRSGLTIVFSLLIAMIFGNKFIKYLQRKQVGESVRDLGLEGQLEKAGTPTMGGIIIIVCILVPVILFTRINSVYVILLIVSTIWMGAVGFLDDYIKVFKKDKEGLQGKFKIVGQVGLGLIVGLTLFYNQHVVVRNYDVDSDNIEQVVGIDGITRYEDVKSMGTTVPFIKDNEFSYEAVADFVGLKDFTVVLYVLISILVVTAVSNGANITDGIDGLSAGTSAIIGFTLMVFAYVSGNSIFADYLNIMYIPNSEEIVVFGAAFVGACVGFLWFNSYPAKIFMGDTGSLCIGGIIAVMALSLRKELLIPVICGIFLVEVASVLLQVSYFKYSKKKYGEGIRIFKMAPLHHHYQKLGMHESKIVTRFWIVGIMLAIVSLATLKLR